ncbi:hypothetical protein [Auraticoccus monumenti]|uniref:Uncharacterized protein n=1 Tax=Auraticoccus monumenti TaxID=675864 RepID=A0A1G7EQ79_9ACTN|nr:hypothetical protein [Auraticoccus monumenti]SDE65769.1 hypothetical protein SAMN04489747_4010 [Auraticoccus monumenti]
MRRPVQAVWRSSEPAVEAPTTVLQVTSADGLALLAAAVDAGWWSGTRRVLLLVDTSPVPEATAPLWLLPEFEPLASRFVEAWSLNDVCFPHHPGAWSPRVQEHDLIARYLQQLLGLAEPVRRLVLESVTTRPASQLLHLFPEAGLDVYASGLTGLCPPPERPSRQVSLRIERTLAVEPVPGLEPLLPGEPDVGTTLLPAAAVRAVLDEAAEAVTPTSLPEGGVPVVLTGLLAPTGLLTPDQEVDHWVTALEALAAAGHGRVVVKPHPAALDTHATDLEAAGTRLGLQVEVVDQPCLPSTVLHHHRPPLVVAGAAEDLLPAALHDLPVARWRTRDLLRSLSPEDGRRVALALAERLVPDLADQPAGGPLRGYEGGDRWLVEAVRHRLRPRLAPDPGPPPPGAPDPEDFLAVPEEPQAAPGPGPVTAPSATSGPSGAPAAALSSPGRPGHVIRLRRRLHRLRRRLLSRGQRG